MTHSIAEKDRIFSEAIDLDYSSVAFEVMVNEPDFWETAMRWLGTTNTVKAQGETYHLSSKRVSKLISLLTAQPSNPACNQAYEQFVIAVHDFLAHATRHLLNDIEQKKALINSSELETPTVGHIAVPHSTVPPLDRQSLMTALSDQVSRKNTWSLDEHTLNSLMTLAEIGDFPLELIDPVHVHTDPVNGNPIASIHNMDDKRQLKAVFSLLMNENVLEQYFKTAVNNHFPGIDLQRNDLQLTAHETLACCIENPVFKNAFDWNWEELRNQGVSKILPAIDALKSTPEVIYSEIESPSVEYLDPQEEAIETETAAIGF